ncbi:16S rRNA (cytidine(1402)-2'-O)-methyltransferase [Bacillus marinisedimentorum]|uniref:16S rRNA (cytidine(1402)-2'-O)-methyltransferase n=1 Tax=Bacillus marinisedimentorum TaxID=1821260 RepID=UPI0008730618|nr:16S rRNA (cytidine(1402)-2'-O)-methyltransferase [Bacillus marinisedimentorum]
MWQQQSYRDSEGGKLYLVPTPIGNLEDMTYRAVKVLQDADLIAAEDTRHTRKLCNAFEITAPVVSYHEHNKEKSGIRLIQDIQEGKTVALVSDAGMPSISDPGFELVQAALQEQMPVIPLPGANAALTALIASGLKPQPFYFFGFLNRNKKERREQLKRLSKMEDTIIFYEAPHRLKNTLLDIEKVLGSRRIVLSRELTKKFEEFIRGTVQEALEWVNQNEVRGEFCVLVEGGEKSNGEEPAWWDALSVIEHVEHYLSEEGLKPKEAVKKAAEDRSMPKREVYQIYHVENED